MGEDKDIVTMENEFGQMVDLYVIGYINYEGVDYAILSEEEDGGQDRYVMQIVPIPNDDENEEFVPVENDLAGEILKVFDAVAEMKEE